MVLLIASGTAQVLTPLQEGTVVLEITNMELDSNEFVLHPVTLEALATHEISASINANDSTITGSIVIIRMMEDGHNRKSFWFSGNEPSKIEEWTPLSEHYIVNITSTDLMEQVRVNLTITQVGEPGYAEFDPDFDPLLDLFIPVLLVSLLPLGSIYLVLVLYKKRFREGTPESKEVKMISAILGLFAVLCPAYFTISSSYFDGEVSVSINSMFHFFIYLSSTTTPWSIFFTFEIFLLFRFVYVWQLYKYYQGDTSRKNAVLAGLVAEMPILLMAGYRILIGLGGPQQINLFIVPLPVFLIVGIILLLMLPPSETVKDWTYVENGVFGK